jgi:hypothetical protein
VSTSHTYFFLTSQGRCVRLGSRSKQVRFVDCLLSSSWFFLFELCWILPCTGIHSPLRPAPVCSHSSFSADCSVAALVWSGACPAIRHWSPRAALVTGLGVYCLCICSTRPFSPAVIVASLRRLGLLCSCRLVFFVCEVVAQLGFGY